MWGWGRQVTVMRWSPRVTGCLAFGHEDCSVCVCVCACVCVCVCFRVCVCVCVCV